MLESEWEKFFLDPIYYIFIYLWKTKSQPHFQTSFPFLRSTWIYLIRKQVFKIEVFNALQTRFNPSKYTTSLKTTLQNATPNCKNEDLTWSPQCNMPTTRTNKRRASSLQEVECGPIYTTVEKCSGRSRSLAQNMVLWSKGRYAREVEKKIEYLFKLEFSRGQVSCPKLWGYPINLTFGELAF